MICSRISGVTMISSERPNSVRGSIRFSHPGRAPAAPKRAAGTGVRPAASAGGGAAVKVSIGLEDIAGTAHGLQVTREFRVALDLAPQPGHLHVDGADVAAELRLLGEVLAR